MNSKRAAVLKGPQASHLITDEKALVKQRQEKQRFYEMRRRQELNESLDSIKDLMLAKFQVSSQSLNSKRAVVDAAIKLLQLFPEDRLPQDMDAVILLNVRSSSSSTSSTQPRESTSSHSSPQSHRTASSVDSDEVDPELPSSSPASLSFQHSGMAMSHSHSHSQSPFLAPMSMPMSIMPMLKSEPTPSQGYDLSLAHSYAPASAWDEFLY